MHNKTGEMALNFFQKDLKIANCKSFDGKLAKILTIIKRSNFNQSLKESVHFCINQYLTIYFIENCLFKDN